MVTKNKWIEHLQEVRKQNPKKNFGDLIKIAKRSYKK